MDVFDEQIIEFVEARKYLYSSKGPGFKDRQLKQNSWESLSQSFASVGKDISGEYSWHFLDLQARVCFAKYCYFTYQQSVSNAEKINNALYI